MSILTDVEHGPQAIADVPVAFEEDSRLIVSGEGSPSAVHAWRCSFYLRCAMNPFTYALELVDFGDPQEADSEEDSGPWVGIVAVWIDPPDMDESAIVRAMLAHYKSMRGQFVDIEEEVGEFDLEG